MTFVRWAVVLGGKHERTIRKVARHLREMVLHPGIDHNEGGTMKSGLIVAIATAVTLVGGASLASAEESGGEGCPNWAGLSGCTEGGAMQFCQTYYSTHYPDCTVTSAHCSSLGNYNCFTTQ